MSAAVITDVREVARPDRSDLRTRLRASIMQRGPKVAIRYIQSAISPERYAVVVEGIDCGWVVRRDDLPADDRWHGYLHTGSVYGRLLVRARQRSHAGEDVAMEALR